MLDASKDNADKTNGSYRSSSIANEVVLLRRVSLFQPSFKLYIRFQDHKDGLLSHL